MESKNELLIFSRKEVLLILFLFILVILFSFTIGIKLGKTLAQSKAEHSAIQTAHPERDASTHKQDSPHQPLDSHDKHDTQPATHAEPAAPEKALPTQDSHASIEAENEKPSRAHRASQHAEDIADAELIKEVAKEKLSISKPIVMDYPNHKKSQSSKPAGHYTLQVGAYRSIAEANDQIAVLKHQNIDAFYFTANVEGKGTWYRVGIGQYPTKEKAESSAITLMQSKELPPYIVQKISDLGESAH